MEEQLRENFEMFEGRDRQWYWRLRDLNGEIVASGEGYTSEAAARDGVRNVVTAALGAAGLREQGGMYLNDAELLDVLSTVPIETVEG